MARSRGCAAHPGQGGLEHDPHPYPGAPTATEHPLLSIPADGQWCQRVPSLEIGYKGNVEVDAEAPQGCP